MSAVAGSPGAAVAVVLVRLVRRVVGLVMSPPDLGVVAMHPVLFEVRGTGYAATDFTEAQGWGFQQFVAPELWHRSLSPLGAEIRREAGGAVAPP